MTKQSKCPKCGAAATMKSRFVCGSILEDGLGQHCQSEHCRISELEQELSMYKKLYEKALKCVDEAFQSWSGHTPILPDFLMIGEDKFEGVVKLAKAYRDLKEPKQ